MYNEKFLEFINKSITCFHAVEEVRKQLEKKGFVKLVDKVELNKKYYVEKNNSSIIAFMTPKTITDFHFQITAAHTDSPTYKLKPNHEVESFNHYKSLNTEPYGGMIHQSWFDKPLSVAGRVFVQKKNKIEQLLVNIDKDLMIIPSLAIHLNENSNKMTYNPQVDLQPLYGLKDSKNILEMITTDNVIDFDLFLYNRYRGSILGANDEFICAPQIDDLLMTYATLEGFLNSKNNNCNVFVAFDNEEVGSSTKQGAASTFLSDILDKIMIDLKIQNKHEVPNKSFMISADNAHAAHPNYQAKTDNKNSCLINNGIAIKYNANQRYTTDGFSASIFKMICNKVSCKFQEIANRSDIRGGSTLGNISTNQFSCHSVDVGLPQLAMHSSVELSGSKDLEDFIKIVTNFFDTKIIISDQTVEFK